jgi:spore germination protein KB
MKNESITQNQASSLIAMFIVGSTIVLGVSKNSKQDSWIALILAIAAVMPLLYVYARLLRKVPGGNLFDISVETLGPVAGKIASALFFLFAVHVGSMIMRIFSQFIQITVFNEMPQTISLLALITLVIWVSRRGVESLCRISLILLPLTVLAILLTVLLLAKDMHPAYLLPVGEYLNEVPGDIWVDFAFPFSEMVLLLAVTNKINSAGRPGRAMVYGVLTGGAILLATFFRNILVLGFPLQADVEFSSYSAVSIIIAGIFLSRIENLMGALLLIAGFFKVSVCLIFASNGLAKILGAEDNRPYVAPLGLLMAAMASVTFKSGMEISDFIASAFPYYSFPFCVALPVLLWAAAEIKCLVKARKEKGGHSGPPRQGS